MGLTDLLRGRSPAAAGVRCVELVIGDRVNAVGAARYQPALEKIFGGNREDGWDAVVQARLVREPGNLDDPNAVKVEVNGTLVGYLSRVDAVAYQPALLKVEKAKAVAVCDGHVVGGWSRSEGANREGAFGIWLDLADPRKCIPVS